jgi:hypothetical protein
MTSRPMWCCTSLLGIECTRTAQERQHNDQMNTCNTSTRQRTRTSQRDKLNTPLVMLHHTPSLHSHLGRTYNKMIRLKMSRYQGSIASRTGGQEGSTGRSHSHHNTSNNQSRSSQASPGSSIQLDSSCNMLTPRWRRCRQGRRCRRNPHSSSSPRDSTLEFRVEGDLHTRTAHSNTDIPLTTRANVARLHGNTGGKGTNAQDARRRPLRDTPPGRVFRL